MQPGSLSSRTSPPPADTLASPAPAAAAGPGRWSRSRRFWALQLGLTIVWVVVWHLGRLLELTAYASLWYPPAGLSFALFLVQGWAAVVPVMIGGVVTSLQAAGMQGDPRALGTVLATAVAFSLLHTLAYGLGARLFARSYPEERLGTPQSVVGFLLLATLSSLMAAVGGLSILMAMGAPHEGGLLANVIPFWIGDLVAVVTLVPVFLIAVDGAMRSLGLRVSGWKESLSRLGPTRTPLKGFVAKLAAAAGMVAILGGLAAVEELGIPVALVAYFLIVPLMWIAHTEGGLRTVVAVAVLAVVVVLLTSGLGLVEEAFEYQAAMIAIAGTGLFNLTVPRLYADNQRLRRLVTYDQLTGARSRPSFLEAAEEVVSRRGRHPTPLSLILLDIDHFKGINDDFGHGVGDDVLARLGDVVHAELRQSDLFGRLGGEEFAVLLPDTDLDAAETLAERLRLAIVETRWPRLGDRKVTASLGVVALSLEEPFPRALERADAALYRAKRAGRNRVSP